MFLNSESTRRQLRIIYGLGWKYRDYHEITIYDEEQESLFNHQIWANYRLIQKWVSINIYANWQNYFHDWSKNRLTTGIGMNFRIVKGGATEQEILLHLKNIETSYYFGTYIGISNTFGSIYNNVVNPRFGGGDGLGIE